MNKFKKTANQELLKKLEQRLPNFDQSELAELLVLLSRKQNQVLTIIQEVSPKTYHWILEKSFQFEQEKIDKTAEELKKSLEDKKKQ